MLSAVDNNERPMKLDEGKLEAAKRSLEDGVLEQEQQYADELSDWQDA